MDIREIFENKIKIEAKVMSIESLFNNNERVNNTNFEPSYQRNYVWDDEKATYFIESILLGTEIPPLVYFRNSDQVEVVDGRQRYQTILRYIRNEFRLRKNGLHKLDNIQIANKLFKDIDSQLQDLFWDTKLRIIEFSFHSRNDISDDVEELDKKEIFNRYNSGITPLKPSEIDNAIYNDDSLNSYIKKKLKDDNLLYQNVLNLFHFEQSNLEIILKEIRQLLVQHEIPIKYYAGKKQTIISKFYDILFERIDITEIDLIFNTFITKINLLQKIRIELLKENVPYNRLISECFFWGFSILENEKISLATLNTQLIHELSIYIHNNIDTYKAQRSSFSKEVFNRYLTTARFFEAKFDVNLYIYLEYNNDFKQKNKEISTVNDERVSFDDLRINKPEPSSIAIMDICRQMERQRFLIRPPYQRNEVINRKKSSSIIESILLGIKLPPIFVYKRSDGISEVLDGQQRLLSILGFIKEPYLDENNNKRTSDKNGFALNLKHGILKNLHTKRFEQLTREEQDKIKNFDLWIIEIDHKNNKNFEPIDLFVRLNNKPYPIKDDTFEMWNSYISRDIIESIKSIQKNHNNWFYYRKNNSRMENENIYTALAYFQYCRTKENLTDLHSNTFSEIDIYKIGNKINFRAKSKNEITKVLENPENKNRFIDAINHLEFNYIRKIKELLSDKSDSTTQQINKNLDDILTIGNGRRTQQSFYALWYFMCDISFKVIKENKIDIRNEVRCLFSDMSDIKDKKTFEEHVIEFKEKYSKINDSTIFDYALLKEISSITIGIKENFNTDNTYNKISYQYLKKVSFSSFRNTSTLDNIEIDINSSIREVFDSKSKILIDKNLNSTESLNVALYESRIAYSSDIIGIILTRPVFSIKFIIGLLSSRYYFYLIFSNKSQKINELNTISINDINNLPIPLISLIDQKKIELIVDYILFSPLKSKSSLFFKRLLDTMVYEIFFVDKFKTSDIDIKSFVSDLVEIRDKDDERRKLIIDETYKRISSSESLLSTYLLRMLNIDEIKRIESM